MDVRSAEVGITPACAGSRRQVPPLRSSFRDHPRVRGEQHSHTQPIHQWQESPPRARGAAREPHKDVVAAGIIPACAGSRPASACRGGGRWDHPRVRGEQSHLYRQADRENGSPPRARGAGPARRAALRGGGITPACAGSRGGSLWTIPGLRDPPPACAGSRAGKAPLTGQSRDHPRVRGEQSPGWPKTPSLVGSPPRARGAGPSGPAPILSGGITPACAGSSGAPGGRGGRSWGSPPRARGAGCLNTGHKRAVGITPACAGSRGDRSPGATFERDHPRVRGEQLVAGSGGRPRYGSPPRARGADPSGPAPILSGGITPACAGSRQPGRLPFRPWKDHPRVRGEQAAQLGHGVDAAGSPPRARGAEACPGRPDVPDRITPACAGSRGRTLLSRPARGDHPRVRGEQTPPPADDG